MRNSFVKLTVAACVLVAVAVVPAAAQSTSVGANLTFLREEGDQTGAGVSIDAARGLTPSLAVAGEFGYNSFDGYSITSYLGGLRFTPAIEAPVQPFVQALIGLEHCCDQNAFAFQLGGGVEVPVNASLKIRGQYDYRHTRYDGEGFNGHRFGVGVVLPLGN